MMGLEPRTPGVLSPRRVFEARQEPASNKKEVCMQTLLLAEPSHWPKVSYAYEFLFCKMGSQMCSITGLV